MGTTKVLNSVSVPFVVGNRAAFYYMGVIRTGQVKKVTRKTVSIFDDGRGAFRTFLISKINK